jgi:predicted small lipoprotein YifL
MCARKPKSGSSGWKKSKNQAEPINFRCLCPLARTTPSLYGGAQFRDRYVTPRSNRPLSKLTVIGLLALTCILAGCGRKAGLDLPPGASAAPAGDDNSANSAAVGQGDVYRAPGSDKAPAAPRGEKKRIILDPILD